MFKLFSDNLSDLTNTNNPKDYDKLDRNERVYNVLINPPIINDGDDLSIYTVNEEDNIGDFTNINKFNDFNKKEEEKQNNNLY